MQQPEVGRSLAGVGHILSNIELLCHLLHLHRVEMMQRLYKCVLRKGSVCGRVACHLRALNIEVTQARRMSSYAAKQSMVLSASSRLRTKLMHIEDRGGARQHLGQELQAAGQHGVDAPDAGEVEGGGQLLLAHAQPQQVARRHIAQQDLLKQIVQRLQKQTGARALPGSADTSPGNTLNIAQ